MSEKDIIIRIKKIEKILTERERRNSLANYNSGEVVHEKQLAFHKCQKRNRWVFGGNRSGKTECGAVEVVYMARGIHPYRKNRPSVNGWVVSVSYEVQREVAQNKILNYLNPDWIVDVTMREGTKSSPQYGIIDTISVKNVLGGVSKIGFKSADQGREKFQGASLDFVWFDEEPPQDVYEECKMRVLDKKGDIFGTMTPLKGVTFLYDTIYLNKYADEEVWYEKMEWADNPFLDKEEVARLSSSLTESSLSSRRYGNFDINCGLVYPEFDERVHVIEPFEIPPDWQDTISIDPGLRNPLSAHFYCCDYDDNVYVVAEHYEKDKDVCYHSERIKRIADSLQWRRNNRGFLQAIIDSAAGQRTLSASKSVSELFYEQGILTDTRVNKDIFSGINRVKSYFSARPQKIYIFNTCKNMIRELKSYWWSKDDVPIKKDDHAMDELRYYIMTKPHNKPTKIDKTPEQKHFYKLLTQNCRFNS